MVLLTTVLLLKDILSINYFAEKRTINFMFVIPAYRGCKHFGIMVSGFKCGMIILWNILNVIILFNDAAIGLHGFFIDFKS